MSLTKQAIKTTALGLLVLILISALTACADVYQWQDGTGKQHYSDRAQANSKKITLNPGLSYYRVEKVLDGDTVKLEDGRKIRLLGINAPEVRHRNQLAEPGGEAAKQWLTRKLTNQKVRLITDVELTDKYQRTLAHIVTENKEHINLQLLEKGLAVASIYPPNLLYADEISQAQEKAEKAGVGIWGMKEYQPIQADDIEKINPTGWVRVIGKVKSIRKSRKYIYLVFNEKLQARIAKKWLQLFPDMDGFFGKKIEVRSKLKKYKNAWVMPIRYPDAVQIS
jgi:endonuclease YncB( thermonuclease family)